MALVDFGALGIPWPPKIGRRELTRVSPTPRGEDWTIKLAIEALQNGVNNITSEQITDGTITYEDLKPGLGNPVGTIIFFAGTYANFIAAYPTGGFAAANGGAISRAIYAKLFTLIGTTYGAGDGLTTFNVPDLQGRTAVMLGTNADVNALADNDGLALASRTPKHIHTGGTHAHSMQGHTHSYTVSVVSGAGGDHLHTFDGGRHISQRDNQLDDAGTLSELYLPGAGTGQMTMDASGDHTHTVDQTANTAGPSVANTGNAGAVATDAQGPAYLTLNAFIRVGPD